MKYIVYLTINTVNNFMYVGVHKTENPEVWDHYLGCGCYDNSPKSYNCRETAFQCAVAKYGPKKFHRKTIKVFDTLLQALELESKIVTSSFIERIDVYNQVVGGGYPPSSNKQIYQYDLEGNLIEWTSEKDYANGGIRSYRGSCYGLGYPAFYRNCNGAYPPTSNNPLYSLRFSLYIKQPVC